MTQRARLSFVLAALAYRPACAPRQHARLAAGQEGGVAHEIGDALPEIERIQRERRREGGEALREAEA